MLDVAQFTVSTYSTYSTSICDVIADEHVGSTDATGPGATGPGATGRGATGVWLRNACARVQMPLSE